MAEPIRNYDPIRDHREESGRKLDEAPADHAEALLAAYAFLQTAYDHGWLDTLRGAIGASAPIAETVSRYASSPEGTRLSRNILAGARVLAELDPRVLDAAAEALASVRDDAQNSRSPSLWRTLRCIAGGGSRRALAAVTEFFDAFGRELDPDAPDANRRGSHMAGGAAVPLVASTFLLMAFSFWVGRRSLSR